MPDRVFGFDTLCLHAGQIPDAQTGARALPIYQTTSFVFDSADHAASLFNLQTFGNVYSRISNPTVAALEERVAALEGGRAALATATGMAAQMVALLTLAQAGDHIVSARTLYGGTYTQFAVTFAQFGIETTFVDADDPEAFRAAIRPNTKAIYAETIGNPQLNVCDLAALAAIAHDAGIPLVVDNTLASPYLCRPFEHGADIVVHSLTKYLGGHGTTMGGIVVESGKFPWDNGKLPADDGAVARLPRRALLRDVRRLRLHDEGAHGDDAHARADALAAVRVPAAAGHRDAAPAHAAALRVGARGRAAPRVASAGRVGAVPAAARQPRARASRRSTCRAAPAASSRSACKGGARAGEKFIEAVQFLSHLANVGDAKTLVIHPASTTHRQLSEDEQVAAGVLPEMIRLSIGLESLDDILWDIDQALDASRSHDPLSRRSRGRGPAFAASRSRSSRRRSLLRWLASQPPLAGTAWRIAVVTLGVASLALLAAAAPPAPAIVLGALVCAALIGYALYAQYGLGLEPCPLCMFQRVAVIALRRRVR